MNFSYFKSFKSPVYIFIIAFISFYVWGFWSLQEVCAQAFVTYRNPSLGFTIDYPTDWKIDDKTPLFSSEKGVTFTPPSGDIPAFFVRIRPVPSYLDIDTMIVKNKTAEQIAHEEMINMSKPNPYFDSKIIRQNQFTVDGNAGWKMEMFMGPEDNPFFMYLRFLL